MTTEMILSICLGIGLAASSGFRVFVPLFGMSLASYFGILPLGESWLWLGSTTALVILVVASIAESMSYLVPFVDNLLDTIAVPLAGMAGSLTDMSPAMTWALAIVAGGGAAATKDHNRRCQSRFNRHDRWCRQPRHRTGRDWHCHWTVGTCHIRPCIGRGGCGRGYCSIYLACR